MKLLIFLFFGLMSLNIHTQNIDTEKAIKESFVEAYKQYEKEVRKSTLFLVNLNKKRDTIEYFFSGIYAKEAQERLRETRFAEKYFDGQKRIIKIVYPKFVIKYLLLEKDLQQEDYKN